jgi:N-acyl amino acid synthase of PEP-CTERM/exosortase system
MEASDHCLTLSDFFYRHFQVVVANTPELREAAFQVRYRVYCEELKYEDAQVFPDKLEHDAFDSSAIHCLLKHHASGQFIGCIRVLLAGKSESDPTLPFRRFLQVTDLPFEHRPLDRFNHCEVSRLAIVGDFRKRKGESEVAYPDHYSPQLDARRMLPSMALGLYLASTAAILELGIDNAFAMMEPRLARHLQRFGLYFRQAGPLVEYHGQRAPYHIIPRNVPPNLHQENHQLFKSIQSTLRLDMQSLVNHFFDRPEPNLSTAA